MANPLFNALGGASKASNNPMMNFIRQFPKFMNDMKGKNPNDMINELVSSGRISQEQLNFAQQRAQETMGMFDQFKGMFH